MRPGTEASQRGDLSAADFATVERAAGLRGLDASELPEEATFDSVLHDNSDGVRAALREHGALLLRGFGDVTPADVERGMTALGPILEYTERSSPRSRVSGRVYTSTDYPPSQRIFLHNENSYASAWPQWIAFCCVEAPAEGGQTPIADVERVEDRIHPEVRERFLAKGIRYVRNYGQGLGLDWQEAFQTSDRAEVESHCERSGIRLRWDGESLHTEWETPATVRNTVRGRETWFNHATFFHVSTLPEEISDALRLSYEEDALPTNTFFGDGSPIPDEVAAHLRQAYEEESVAFTWQVGDVLLLDNMRFAHGRAPYRGSRKVVVCMAAPISRA
jgi:hypothetical protein